MSHTSVNLVRDLERLGVEPGITLWIHASYKSLGAVEDGPAGVIEAMESAVGTDGTLVMPSFNMASRDKDERASHWSPATSPSTVGYLTEYFRQMPGTHRSDHYSHSVAARGASARWLTEGHRAQEGLVSPWDREPWGRTFGTHSPFMRALDAGVQVLLVGVDCRCLTYIHLAEVMDYNRCLDEDPGSSYRFADRAKVDAWWKQQMVATAGYVSAAPCLLFGACDFVQAILAEFQARPAELLVDADTSYADVRTQNATSRSR